MGGLSDLQKSILAQSSRLSVTRALSTLARNRHAKWLPDDHAFRRFPPPRPPATGPISRQSEITEYLAISAPNHCIDGWGFLARSLASLVSGDGHASRHFAYYAELRAALSLLSATGIGIFNNWNCVTDSLGKVFQLDDVESGKTLGTHAMAWLALNEWATTPEALAQISDSFGIGSASFRECVSAMWPGSVPRPVASELILAWGFDLRMSSRDRAARNLSSYLAQALSPLRITADETLNFLEDFWGVFDPEPDSPFHNLDRFLFRVTVEKQYLTMFGPPRHPNRLGFEIARVFGNLDVAVQRIVSRDFLIRRESRNDPSLLSLARKQNVIPHPFEMVARASLLLRSATAIVNKLLVDAGLDRKTDLEFWSIPYGENLGFWKDSTPPEHFFDLMADVDKAISDATNARRRSPQPFSRLDWASAVENGVPRIFEAERIALWSICA